MPKKLPEDQHRVSVTFRVPQDVYAWLIRATIEQSLDAGRKVTKSELIAACLQVAMGHPHRLRLVREQLSRDPE